MNDESNVFMNGLKNFILAISKSNEIYNNNEVIISNLNEKLKSAYKSSSSGTMIQDTANFIESFHNKNKNLSSFKLYTQKRYERFHMTNIKAEKITNEIADNYIK